jgi:hypothetical protein
MDMSIIDAERALCAACDDLEGTVLGYEIWSMLEPDAVFDITKHWWTCSPLKDDLVARIQANLRRSKGLAQSRINPAILRQSRHQYGEMSLSCTLI